MPALRASRPDVWSTLKDTIGSIAGAGGSVFLRKGLVAAQVALSLVLLFGAGLFVRSLQNLKTTDTGFRDPDNLVTFQLNPALNGYSEARGKQFFQDLLDRVRAIPGVKSAGIAAVPVLHGWEWDNSMQVEGHKSKDGENMQAFMNAVSPGYFATMGVPTGRRTRLRPARRGQRRARRKWRSSTGSSPATSSATAARWAGISETVSARRRSSI